MKSIQNVHLHRFPAFLLIAAILWVLPAPRAALADDRPVVKVENVRVRAVPPVSSATAAYMVLSNLTNKPIRLVGGETSIAGVVEPMISTRPKPGTDMVGMETVDYLEIPAHATRSLKPGGDHLMLMELKEHPKPGDKLLLKLKFEPGPVEISVVASVFE